MAVFITITDRWLVLAHRIWKLHEDLKVSLRGTTRISLIATTCYDHSVGCQILRATRFPIARQRMKFWKGPTKLEVKSNLNKTKLLDQVEPVFLLVPPDKVPKNMTAEGCSPGSASAVQCCSQGDGKPRTLSWWLYSFSLGKHRGWDAWTEERICAWMFKPIVAMFFLSLFRHA